MESSFRGPLDVNLVPPQLETSSQEALGIQRSYRHQEYSTMVPIKRESLSPLEANWTTNHNVFTMSSNHHRGGGDTIREDEEKKEKNRSTAEAAYYKMMQDAQDHVNDRVDATEPHRNYSAKYMGMAPTRTMSQDTAWLSGQETKSSTTTTTTPLDIDSPFDAFRRMASSTSATPTLERTPFSLNSEARESNMYKPYQSDLRAIPQYSSGQVNGEDALRSSNMFFSTPTGSEEFSIFVGDLSPDLREEDLVKQFLEPSAWPSSHPFAIAYAHAQQIQGNYGTPLKIRPAPFTSTKSAKIMTDPLTGASRGFGFVRFSEEEDCNRALQEMQGMVINPVNGIGRPLRVCTATPKNRSGSTSTPSGGASSLWTPQSINDAFSLHQQLQQHQDRITGISPLPIQSPSTYKTSSSPFSPATYGYPSSESSTASASAAATQNNSAIDPNNTTVFVGGLSSLISEDTLKTFFAPFGEIIYVKIPPGKGCGFVQFVRKMDAERAIERMQGFPIGGGRIRLSWGRSQGDKAAAAAAQAVAQNAQISHLANLAGWGALTPTQLSQLTSATLATPNSSTASEETSALLLRRLAAAAAAAASPAVAPPQINSNREREQRGYDRSIADSVQHLPALEMQHREAQYKMYHSEALAKMAESNYDSPKYGHNLNDIHHTQVSDFALPWSGGEQRRKETLAKESDLSFTLSSLQLGSNSEKRQSIHQDGQEQVFSPSKKMKSLQSTSFSPFSPINSPSASIPDDLPLTSTTEKERYYTHLVNNNQQNDVNNNNNNSNHHNAPYTYFLESDHQKQQHSPQRTSPHSTTTSSIWKEQQEF